MPKKLPEGEGKRVPLNMRTTRETRDKLEQAASKSGRSLAQEIELRLERSFDLEEIIKKSIETTADLFGEKTRDLLNQSESLLLEIGGGDDLFMFWGRLAMTIKSVEHERGSSIRENAETRDAAERAVLGAVPGLFRNIPGSYSDFRKAASSRSNDLPAASGLAALGQRVLPEPASQPEE